MLAELVWNMKAIYEVIGVVPKVMRPPYGSTNADLLRVASALGLTVINWTETSMDFSFVGDTENTRKNVLEKFNIWAGKKEKGMISLQHDLFLDTTLYIDKVISIISNAGYNFMTVADCLNVIPITNIAFIIDW